MSLRDVVAVLEADEADFASTLEAAIDLAQTECARLTLLTACHAPTLTMWCGPFAPGALYVPPDAEDPERVAQRRLARALEAVPAEIPVTLQVIGAEPVGTLVRLLRGGGHDALVAPERMLRRARRLRRVCAREGIHIRAVTEAPPVRGRLPPDRADHVPLRDPRRTGMLAARV